MIRRGGSAALLVLLLAGCRTMPELPPLAPDDPRPRAWLEALAVSAEQLHGLRARARVRVAGETETFFAREIVLLERPARLRVEVLGLMGQRVALLATDGDEYDLYRAETRRVETGPMHLGILYEVAGVPLGTQEAVTLLLGVPALSPDYAFGEALPDGGARVHWRGELRSHADLGPDGRLLAVSIARPDDGRTVLAAEWSDHLTVDGVPFAHRVQLDFPGTKRRIEVEFSDVELNPQLDPSLFRLSSTPGGPGPPSGGELR